MIITLTCLTSAGQLSSKTGFYSLTNKTVTKNGDIYGYFGEICIKQLNSSRIVVKLSICKGAPSYNSGTLTDTLTFYKNKATYTTIEDATCKIIFTFYQKGIKLEQFAENPNFACGFGHGVDAYGFYKRKSFKTPSDKELTEE